MTLEEQARAIMAREAAVAFGYDMRLPNEAEEAAAAIDGLEWVERAMLAFRDAALAEAAGVIDEVMLQAMRGSPDAPPEVRAFVIDLLSGVSAEIGNGIEALRGGGGD